MTFKRPKSARNADLAKIHLAKKQLALSDEDYRAMLWTVARVKSSAELDAHGRKRVLEHLKSRGFKPRRPRPGLDAPARRRGAQLGKIRAYLADAGLPDSYGDGIAKRVVKRERLEFCSSDDLAKIIAALEYDQRRRIGREEIADFNAIHGTEWKYGQRVYVEGGTKLLRLIGADADRSHPGLRVALSRVWDATIEPSLVSASKPE